MKLTKIQEFLSEGDDPSDKLKVEVAALVKQYKQLQSETEKIRNQLNAEREENKRLIHLASIDPDTMLPLHRTFMTDLGLLIEERRRELAMNKRIDPNLPATSFAVAHIVLDEETVRSLPDDQTSHLHKILLFKTASRLNEIEMLRDRVYQGERLEEFLIILPQIRDQVSAEVVLSDYVIPAIQTPHQAGEDSIQFNCYAGIVVYPQHGENFGDLTSNLTIAVRHSLREKQAVSMYADDLGLAHRKRSMIQKELHSASQSGYQGFELHYQPFVDRENMVIGCEALIRWNHPRLGFISPGEFISIAEKTGDIKMLGRWVLYTACRQMQAWKEAGHQLYVSVNLSPVQFAEQGLVDSVVDLLDSLKIDGSEVKLEITEGIIFDNPKQAVTKMEELRSHGIRLAIDDFGTGYSSLNYLMNLPINTLKIDKSFVDGLMVNEGNKVIVRSIIGLARNLGLNILAEGVETADQKDFLFNEGIDYIQGYYYSKPVPAAQFIELLERQPLE